jgi:hypothetical protein
MRLLLLLLSLTLTQYLNAQDASSFMKVKNGTDISKTLPYSERFLYPTFLDGKVFFRNGRIVNAKLNYSLPHGEVQFVDAKKDTLILTDKDFIDRITIGADTFYYYQHHGHVRKVLGFDQVSLAEKQMFGTSGTERHSAYDQYTSTSAISSYSSYTNSSGQQQALQGSDKVILKKRYVFFLLDKNRVIYPANRGALLKIFPRHKKALSEYIKTNKIEFFSVDQISKTLEYASSL